MNKEKIKSIIRAVLQIFGVLVALNVNIPFLGSISDALTYILGEADAVYAAGQAIVGFALTMYGFFKDGDRHEDREVGAEVKTKARMAGVSVSSYIKR